MGYCEKTKLRKHLNLGGLRESGPRARIAVTSLQITVEKMEERKKKP